MTTWLVFQNQVTFINITKFCYAKIFTIDGSIIILCTIMDKNPTIDAGLKLIIGIYQQTVSGNHVYMVMK